MTMPTKDRGQRAHWKIAPWGWFLLAAATMLWVFAMADRLGMGWTGL